MVHGWAYLAGTDNADFDLYIRWKYNPTTSVYDDRGYTSQAQEICDASWTISGAFLRVMPRSYFGSGSYVLLILIF